MEELSSEAYHGLELLRRQYLQLQPTIRYPDSAILRQESFQRALYNALFNDEEVIYQPPQRYQLRFLKEIVAKIESSIVDWDEDGVNDDIMSRLCILFSSPIPSEVVAAQQKAYVTYTLSSLRRDPSPRRSPTPPTTTLLESRNLLAAAGITGFRTWEASLHLGNYLSSSDCSIPIAGKNVLELGAGTGFLSILCAKHLGAEQVTATDGSDTVVSEMPTNLYLNDLEDTAQIRATELVWGQALLGGETEQWNLGRKVDVVLGADVTYDKGAIPSLVATLEDLTTMFPDVIIVIGVTIRNESTFDSFLSSCTSNKFVVDELPFEIPSIEMQEGPFYSTEIPVKGNWLRYGLGRLNVIAKVNGCPAIDSMMAARYGGRSPTPLPGP